MHEISESDVKSEGVQPYGLLHPSGCNCLCHDPGDLNDSVPCEYCVYDHNAFARLWDSINAKRGYGWGVNPWVWVVSFRRIES